MVRGIPITGILITRKSIPALAFLAADSKLAKKELYTELFGRQLLFSRTYLVEME